MIGRRGFLKAIGVGVLGMALALRATQPQSRETRYRLNSETGLFLSRDGGRTWEPYSPSDVVNVEVGDHIAIRGSWVTWDTWDRKCWQ